jgi:hypothetical protein
MESQALIHAYRLLSKQQQSTVQSVFTEHEGCHSVIHRALIKPQQILVFGSPHLVEEGTNLRW